jgi:hypothetical protein
LHAEGRLERSNGRKDGTMDPLQAKRAIAIVVMAGAWLLGGCSAAPSDHASVATSTHDTGLRLTPDPVSAGSEIRVVFDDAWIRPEACRYAWSRNGAPIAGAVAGVLGPTQFTKHDRIGVEVTIATETGRPAHTMHAEITIANSPPSVKRAWVSATTTSRVPALVAGAETADADRDSIHLIYRWFRNDRAIDGVTSGVLPFTSLRRGDRITVEVVADDGDSRSPAVRSAPFAYDDHIPKFATAAKSSRTRR